MNKKTLVAMAERIYHLVFVDRISESELAHITSIFTFANVALSIYMDRKEVKLITDKYIVSAYYDIEDCKMFTFVERPL